MKRETCSPNSYKAVCKKCRKLLIPKNIIGRPRKNDKTHAPGDISNIISFDYERNNKKGMYKNKKSNKKKKIFVHIPNFFAIQKVIIETDAAKKAPHIRSIRVIKKGQFFIVARLVRS